MMIMSCCSPTKNGKFRLVGKDDLMKHLEITSEEAETLQEHVTFNYYFKGDDHENGEKYTFDGDGIYKNFSLRNFFLSNICDMYRGAKILNAVEICKSIESVKGLQKWLHFGSNRVTIKDLYEGEWKNFWKFC